MNLILFNEKRCIEISTHQDRSFSEALEPVQDGGIRFVCRGSEYILGDIPLKMNKKTVAGPITALLYDSVEQVFSRKKEDVLRIGTGEACHICLEQETPVTALLKDDSLTLYEGSCYINGSRCPEGTTRTRQGDLILIGDMKITVEKDRLICEGVHYHTKLRPFYEKREGMEEFPVYKRSPRVMKRQPENQVQLQAPAKAEAPPRRQLARLIIPPLVMLCMTITVSVVMKRGLFVLVSAASMGMSLVFSVTSYVGDKKERRIREKRRRERYETYLLDQRKRLARLYQDQKEALTWHYPPLREIERMTMFYSSRIYERKADDSDFLCFSLGNAPASASFRVKFEEHQEDEEDPLAAEARDMLGQFREIPDMPSVIDLKLSHLGLVGEQVHIHRLLTAIIMQLAFFQSYHDIEIVMLTEEACRSHFEWITWYPHCRVHHINVSGLVSGENQRDQVLGSLAQILKMRKQKRDEGKQETLFLPHYVIIIDDPRLVINHSIMEFLQADQRGMGFSLIYTTNQQANLPDYIKTIMILNGRESGTLLMKEGKLMNRIIALQEPEDCDGERMARKMAALIHNQGMSTQIPDSITFFSLYQVKRPEELPVEVLWRKNVCYKSLAVPLGVRGKDDIVCLNLHEKAHGPHGLVAGTTGSGKSEILQSYILSLAVNFHPHEVGFLLIDYKGGGMANLFRDLPHLLGTITNLDGSESMRALASIKSELARRQRIFNENGVNNINQYSRLFRSGKAEIPLPHLFLISDEFAELKKEQPDFMSELVSAARIGRSLGVHLILATQKPSGVVDDQIWSNSRFKLALKVQNESDSNEVLKTPDAARITLPGRAYLQVGNNEIYELFQSAWSGADYSESEVEMGFDNRVYFMNRLGQGELLNEDLSSGEESQGVKLTQLDVVVNRIQTLYKRLDERPVERPWLPPLAEQIVNPHVSGDRDVGQFEEYDLSMELGVVDIPEEQKQEEYIHNFSEDGNLAVFGAAGFGKSTTLMNGALTLACRNSPEKLHYYILDFGNSALVQLKGLPHTADYMGFDDEEKLKKLMKLLGAELQSRKRLFAAANAINFKMYNETAKEALPAVILWIDNYDVIREIGMELEDFLVKLTRDGGGIGIYTVITASRANAVRYSVLNNFKNKLVHFLYDRTDVVGIVGRSSYQLPEIRGRAAVKLDNVNLMQCYLPVEYEDDRSYTGRIGSLIQEIERSNTAKPAEGIRVMPEILSFERLMAQAPVRERQAVVGLDTEEILPQCLDLSQPVTLIVGAPQTGKTNILKMICRQAGENKVLVADSRSYDLQETEGMDHVVYCGQEADLENFAGELKREVDGRKEQFEGQKMRLKEFIAANPCVLLLIDDGDNFIELCKPRAKEMETLMAEAVTYGISVVVTTAPSKLRGYDNMTKLWKESQSGLVLGNPGEQNLFPITPMRGYKAGVEKGFLYQRGSIRQIRMPLVDLIGRRQEG